MNNSNLKEFYKNKRILITGHTGFKGIWMSLVLHRLGAKIYGLSLNSGDGIYNQIDCKNIFEEELFCDISVDNFDNFINRIRPEIVFHLAAQSLVIESYNKPLQTLLTNSIGTFKVLNTSNKNIFIKAVICATTDKVYKDSASKNSEDGELGGIDFYSTSKVNAENIINTFIKTLSRENLKISVVRSGNILGGGERGKYRLFTDLINSALNNKKIKLRYPHAIRPWQYILDSVIGYLLVGKYSIENDKSEIFNLNSEKLANYEVIDIVNAFYQKWDDDLEVEIIEKKSKISENKELRIDSKKAYEKLNWIPQLKIDDLIDAVVKWEKSFKEIKTLDYSISEIDEYLFKLNP